MTTVEVIPPIDRETAVRVLTEIDGLIEWVKDATDKAERAGIRLGRLLAQLHQGQYWIERGCYSEEEYIHKCFPQSRAQYFKLKGIGRELIGYPIERLEEIGVSKCQDIVRIKRHSGGVIEENWWLHARADDRETFRRRVRSHVSGRNALADPTVEDHFVTFRIFGDDIMVVNQAFKIAGLEAGSEKSTGYLLKMICADYLAGHTEEGARLKDQDGMNLLLIGQFVENLSFSNTMCAERLVSTIAAAVERAKARS